MVRKVLITEISELKKDVKGLRLGSDNLINRLKGGTIMNLDREAVLPLRDLARAYDYSKDYLRNLINRGHLKAHKKGKLWYVRVRDLSDYGNAQ